MADIRKRFGAVKVLRGVNLTVGEGEVIGLVGDNGAGKSTLMKMLAGAVAPDSGQILVDGSELTGADPRESRRAGIEMVYQDLALCNDIDVAGNLFLGREPFHPLTRRLDLARMHREAAEELEKLHIRIPDTTQEVGTLQAGSARR